jgi:beta-lactamase regulating signal transducer with metallopeptidase domain
MSHNVMSQIAGWLAPNLPLFLAAVTLLLAVGGLCLALVRSPAHRQRIGELTLAAVLGWLALAAIPLPRWLPSSGADDRAAVRDTAPAREFSTAERVTTGLPPAASIDAGPIADNVLDSIPTDSAASDSATGGASRSGLPSRTWSRPAGGTYSSTESRGIVVATNDETAAFSPRAPQSLSTLMKPDMKRDRLEVAASIYLVAAAGASLWLLLGHLLLARERFTAVAPPAWLYRLLHDAVSTWEGRLPRLVVSHRCSRPLSWGVWRPMIVLPERICHAENRDQLRTILLHEMGHIRRGDARGNLLFELAFPLLFFHPLYWWLRGEVRMAAELVADDWAARQTGKEVYVAELVALARGSSRRRLSFLAGTGVFSSPSQFYRRMQMLLTRENPLTTRPSVRWRIASAAGLAVAVAFAAALAGNRPAVGQQTENAAAKEAPKSTAPDATNSAAVDEPISAATAAPSADAKDLVSQALAAPPAAETAPAIGVGAAPPARAVPTAPAAEATPSISVAPAADAVAPPGVALPSVTPAQTTSVLPSPAGGDAATTADLQAEKAKLLDEIQALRAKLHELKGSNAADGYPHGNWASPPADKNVFLTRADENGRLVQERWLTDANGKPTRIVERIEISDKLPIAGAAAGLSNGKIAVKTFKDKDGGIWLYTYDAKSGKLIEARKMTNEPPNTTFFDPAAAPESAAALAPKSNYDSGTASGPAAEPATTPAYPPAGQQAPAGNGLPSLPPTPATSSSEDPIANRAPHARGGGSDAASSAVSNRPLDLITLATSYADTVGAVELAKAKLAEAEAKSMSSSELLPYRATVASAQRKEKLLRRIAEVATAGAKQEYGRVVQLHRTGLISADEMSDVKSRLEILEQIRNTRGDEAPEQVGGSKP